MKLDEMVIVLTPPTAKKAAKTLSAFKSESSLLVKLKLK